MGVRQGSGRTASFQFPSWIAQRNGFRLSSTTHRLFLSEPRRAEPIYNRKSKQGFRISEPRTAISELEETRTSRVLRSASPDEPRAQCRLNLTRSATPQSDQPLSLGAPPANRPIA